MRVLLNTTTTTGALTGVGHYTSELLRCLRQQTGAEAIGVFPGFWVRQARRAWAGVRPLLSRRRAHEPGPVSPSWRARLVGGLRDLDHTLLQASVRTACRRGGYELYHEPNFIPLESDLPVVATIHDLSVLHRPEWHPPDRAAHFERRFRAGLRRCVHFLTISENGRQEVISALGLRPEQVTRTYMGVRHGLGPMPAPQVGAALRRLGLPSRYLLCLGTLEPRKNISTLLRAYTSLPGRLREAYPLLLVGGWGWNAAELAAELAAARHLGVRHLGYVADENLAALYNGARALAFPSFYEGFGLPPIEMLACGGAVLASTAGAVAETAGRKAHLIDPHDTDGWRAALLRVLTDDDWWSELRRGAVEVAAPFTWEQCAADTLAVYRALTQERRAAA